MRLRKKTLSYFSPKILTVVPEAGDVPLSHKECLKLPLSNWLAMGSNHHITGQTLPRDLSGVLLKLAFWAAKRREYVESGGGAQGRRSVAQ